MATERYARYIHMAITALRCYAPLATYAIYDVEGARVTRRYTRWPGVHTITLRTQCLASPQPPSLRHAAATPRWSRLIAADTLANNTVIIPLLPPHLRHANTARGNNSRCHHTERPRL